MTIIENDKKLLIKENEELKNKIANNKNNNINNINQNEEINSLKDELSFKNSIIKYLEDILYNNKNKAIEDSLRDEYEKNKKRIKKNLEKNKDYSNKNNKKKIKLNKNEESNNEIDFEFNNDNLSDDLNDIIINKEKIRESDDKKRVEPLKKEIDNLDKKIKLNYYLYNIILL